VRYDHLIGDYDATLERLADREVTVTEFQKQLGDIKVEAKEHKKKYLEYMEESETMKIENEKLST